MVDVRSLAAIPHQKAKRCRHSLDFPEHYNLRQRLLFSEDSAPHPKVIADLPVVMGPFSGAITNAILHDRISSRRRSAACVEAA